MAYKVTDSRNRSAVVKGTLQTQYRAFQWVSPEYGPSLVFLKLEDARAFRPVIYFRVWRCQTKRLRPISKVVHTWVLTRLFARSFWAGELLESSLMSAPQGTYAADAVMLTKEVKP